MKNLPFDTPNTRSARILMSALFLVSGTRKILTWPATVDAFTSLGIPFANVLTPLVIVLEIGCALMLISGKRTRDVATILAIYTLLSTLIADRFWSAAAAQFTPQLNDFFKNLGLVGGFLLLIGCAPRPRHAGLSGEAHTIERPSAR